MVNRFLLWGLMTFAAGVAVIISVIGILAGALFSPPLILVLSCFGVVHAACLFLAFHAPDWYRLWLQQRASAEVA